MSDLDVDKLKQEAKDYAWMIFNQSESDRIDSFNHFVDIVWIYIDQRINECKKSCPLSDQDADVDEIFNHE